MTTEARNLPPAFRAAMTSSAGERPSLRERQHQRTYNDLLQATLEVIAERGVEHTTIQRITSRAGTSRATLYAYFPNGRDEIYAQVYRMLGRDLIQRSERIAAEQSDWVGRLCAYVQAMLELASQRQIGLFYNVTGPRLTEMKYQGGGSHRTLVAFTEELNEAQRGGEIAAHLDVEAIAHLLVGAIREAGMHTSTDPSQTNRHQKAFEQLLEAIRLHPKTF